MSEGLTTPILVEGIKRIAAKMAASADELNLLDGQLGDGDLGVTMQRGAQGLADEAPALPEDIGLALRTCAQVFTRASGSTFGTLLATGLLSATKATLGRTEVPWSELSGIVGKAIDEMALRGKGALGDKTLLDALDAVRTALAVAESPASMAVAADDAVGAALDRLRDKPAKQGRARIFADRSIGMDDPGMVAIKRVTESLRP